MSTSSGLTQGPRGNSGVRHPAILTPRSTNARSVACESRYFATSRQPGSKRTPCHTAKPRLCDLAAPRHRAISVQVYEFIAISHCKTDARRSAAARKLQSLVVAGHRLRTSGHRPESILMSHAMERRLDSLPRKCGKRLLKFARLTAITSCCRLARVTKLICKRCGYKWLPRVDKPKRCPNQKCQTVNWNKK
jgi:hypothetical protein